MLNKKGTDKIKINWLDQFLVSYVQHYLIQYPSSNLQSTIVLLNTWLIRRATSKKTTTKISIK